MQLFNPALEKNITFVHPAYLTISGSSAIANIKHYDVFLFFVYIVSVLGNTAVMAIIYLDHNLRTPKYVSVPNPVFFFDLFGSSALVTKFLDIFLFNHHSILYNYCLTYLFFCYTPLSMLLFNLLALSYDSLIAITFPLYYQVRVTHSYPLMLSLSASFWVFVVIAVLIAVGLLTRLSFCKSVVINSYFCDHWQIYRLSCNDNFPNYVISCFYPVLLFWLPLIFILFSYLYILKAFKTCIGHLSFVAVYFILLLITFTLMENIQPNARIINLSLTSSNVEPNHFCSTDTRNQRICEKVI
ncbi:olfactory receptor 1537-like [Chelmon rostratus]|uniref:olfactory receptor 1537-like n=1 Tax=Chelmon rostratus TaxID=109905 RepID=UPI001BE93E43|nr:olfactory receptor 1537-like [Chelmon rostratus]